MRKYTILIVDDEENILRSLNRLFTSEGYNVITAKNAEEGLEFLHNEKIDLVISDQKMPGMTGIEFLEQTIEDFPDLIRIILTGHAELNDALRAINEGCIYKFILKPWNNEDIKITVKRALEQRELILKNKLLTHELQKHEKQIKELEKQFPGISQKPKDGVYRLS